MNAEPTQRPEEPGERADDLNQLLSDPQMRRRLVRVAGRIMSEDAEDVVHDGVVQALVAIRAFRGQAALGTWLHRIIVNAALMRMRRNRTAGKFSERAARDADDQWWASVGGANPGPEEELSLRERLHQLHEAIEALPPAYRDTVRGFLLQEGAAREAAAALGVTTGALLTRAGRARRMLSAALAD